MTTEQRAAPSMDAFTASAQDIVEEVRPSTYMKEGDAVVSPSSGGGDPSGISVSSLRFKGYVRVWDTQTGQESLQPWWLMWQTMSKTRKDGSLVFTRTDPKIAQDYGEDLYCPLNPLSPEHEQFAGMGFKVCTKKHTPHRDALMQHVQKSHKRAWGAMQRLEQDRQRAEDRQLQREAIDTQNRFLEQMMSRSVGQAAVAAPVAIVEKPKFQVACEECGETFERGSKGFATMAMQRHAKRVHSSLG